MLLNDEEAGTSSVFVPLYLLLVMVERLEGGEDRRAAFTEVHPQVAVQTLSELHT